MGVGVTLEPGKLLCDAIDGPPGVGVDVGCGDWEMILRPAMGIFDSAELVKHTDFGAGVGVSLKVVIGALDGVEGVCCVHVSSGMDSWVVEGGFSGVEGVIWNIMGCRVDITWILLTWELNELDAVGWSGSC